jgi:hypothetical protein
MCVYEYTSPESLEIHVNVFQQQSLVSPLLTGGNNSAMDPPGEEEDTSLYVFMMN